MQNTVVSLQNATIQNENKVVLTDINFNVNTGDFVFLIGKTGAGKSSLLEVLYGDLPLSSWKGLYSGLRSGKVKRPKYSFS
jgi:cell division transport system ATP-binding protein